MTRLFVDARLLGHSGIGTYLSELLPRVLPALAPWKPSLIALSSRHDEAARLAEGYAELTISPVAPLSLRDIAFAPRMGPGDVLWVPHFNVPLRGSMPLVTTLHDLLPLTAPRFAGRGRAWPVAAWMRAVRERARAVLCVSEFTR